MQWVEGKVSRLIRIRFSGRISRREVKIGTSFGLCLNLKVGVEIIASHERKFKTHKCRTNERSTVLTQLARRFQCLHPAEELF